MKTLQIQTWKIRLEIHPKESEEKLEEFFERANKDRDRIEDAMKAMLVSLESDDPFRRLKIEREDY